MEQITTIRQLAATALFCVLVGCGGGGDGGKSDQNSGTDNPVTPTPPEPETNDDTFQGRLQDTLESSFALLQSVPGVAVAIATPDQGTVFAGAGIGNTLTDSPVMAEDKFRLASISKMITAAMVLKLQEQGYFHIDDRLAEHLVVPGLPNGDTITIRQLLNHSAGVYDHLNGVNDFWNRADPYKVWTNDEIVQYAIDNGPLSQPGEAYNYSNTGFHIAGMLIESKTGTPLSEAVDNLIAIPLQLPDVFLDDWSTPDNKIDGLAENGRAYEFHKTGVAAAGAMVAPAGQLAEFGRIVYGAEFFEQALVDEMIAPSTLNDAYGLGTRIWPEPTFTHFHVGHTGTLSGYRNILMYIPEQDISIAILSNGYASDIGTWYDLIDDVFEYVTDEYSDGSGSN